jgi:hypothetical protein
MATVDDLFVMLHKKTGFEVVNHTLTTNKLRVLGRVPRQGMNVGNYLVLVHRMLTATENGKRPWSVDISDVYLKKGGKVAYARRWLVQADNIEAHLADIIAVLQSSPGAQRPELEEVKLYGLSPDRNNTAGGRRGAGPMGSVAVGAAAAVRKNLGG